MRVVMIDPGAFTPFYDDALCRALAAEGCDVELVTAPFAYHPWPEAGATRAARCSPAGPGRRRGALRVGASVRRLRRAITYPLVWRKLVGELARRPPEVVHLQWSLLPAVERRALRRLRAAGVRVVQTVHNARPHGGERTPCRPERRLRGEADALVLLSEAGRAELVADRPELASRMRLIPGDPAGYRRWAERGRRWRRDRSGRSARPCSRPPPVRTRGGVRRWRSFSASSGPTRGSTCCSRPSPPVLRELPAARLVVAGLPRPSFRPYARQIDRLGLGERVRTDLRYLPQSVMDDYLAAADLVVLPYRDASQSAVLGAALAADRPVVASATGGLPEMLGGERRAEMLVPAGDVAALAGAMTRLLADRERAAALGRRAGECGAAHASPGRAAAASTAALYRELRGGPANPERTRMTPDAGAGRSAAPPFATVVIPVRNEAGSIADCLRAVAAQDYPPERLEIFVVDGGSRDGSREIVERMVGGDARFRRLENPGGLVPAALNLGSARRARRHLPAHRRPHDRGARLRAALRRAAARLRSRERRWADVSPGADAARRGHRRGDALPLRRRPGPLPLCPRGRGGRHGLPRRLSAAAVRPGRRVQRGDGAQPGLRDELPDPPRRRPDSGRSGDPLDLPRAAGPAVALAPVRELRLLEGADGAPSSAVAAPAPTGGAGARRRAGGGGPGESREPPHGPQMPASGRWLFVAVAALYLATSLRRLLAVAVRRGLREALSLPAVFATMHLAWGGGFWVGALFPPRRPEPARAGADARRASGAAPKRASRVSSGDPGSWIDRAIDLLGWAAVAVALLFQNPYGELGPEADRFLVLQVLALVAGPASSRRWSLCARAGAARRSLRDLVWPSSPLARWALALGGAAVVATVALSVDPLRSLFGAPPRLFGLASELALLALFGCWRRACGRPRQRERCETALARRDRRAGRLRPGAVGRSRSAALAGRLAGAADCRAGQPALSRAGAGLPDTGRRRTGGHPVAGGRARRRPGGVGAGARRRRGARCGRRRAVRSSVSPWRPSSSPPWPGFRAPAAPRAGPARRSPGCWSLPLVAGSWLAWQGAERLTGTASQRLLLWGSVVRLFEASPPARLVVGFGPESLAIVLPPHLPPELPERIWRPDLYHDRAHNAVLDALAAGGLLRLLAGLGLAFAAGRRPYCGSPACAAVTAATAADAQRAPRGRRAVAVRRARRGPRRAGGGSAVRSRDRGDLDPVLGEPGAARRRGGGVRGAGSSLHAGGGAKPPTGGKRAAEAWRRSARRAARWRWIVAAGMLALVAFGAWVPAQREGDAMGGRVLLLLLLAAGGIGLAFASAGSSPGETAERERSLGLPASVVGGCRRASRLGKAVAAAVVVAALASLASRAAAADGERHRSQAGPHRPRGGAPRPRRRDPGARPAALSRLRGSVDRAGARRAAARRTRRHGRRRRRPRGRLRPRRRDARRSPAAASRPDAAGARRGPSRRAPRRRRGVSRRSRRRSSRAPSPPIARCWRAIRRARPSTAGWARLSSRSAGSTRPGASSRRACGSPRGRSSPGCSSGACGSPPATSAPRARPSRRRGSSTRCGRAACSRAGAGAPRGPFGAARSGAVRDRRGPAQGGDRRHRTRHGAHAAAGPAAARAPDRPRVGVAVGAGAGEARAHRPAVVRVSARDRPGRDRHLHLDAGAGAGARGA